MQRTNVLKVMPIIFLLAASIQVSGQKISNVSLAVLNEEIAFPFTRFSPIHPGVELGTTLGTKEKSNSTRYMNAKLGFFHHELLSNAFYLHGEYVIRFNKIKHVGLDLITGLGYMHTFYPGEVYKQKDDGDFEKVTQTGRPHVRGSVGIGVAYLNKSALEPFINYELMIESPFANQIPVIPHSILKVGVNIKFKSNEE